MVAQKKQKKQMPGIKTSSDYKHGRQSVRMQKTTCNVFLPGLFGKTNCAASRRTVVLIFRPQRFRAGVCDLKAHLRLALIDIDAKSCNVSFCFTDCQMLKS